MMGQQRMVNGMVPSQMNAGMQPHMNGPVKMEQQQYQHMHPMQQHQQAHRVICVAALDFSMCNVILNAMCN